MKKIFSAVLGLFLFASGCTLAPKYKSPQAPIPAAWPAGAAYGETGKEGSAPLPPDLGWREFFTDERLEKVIELALANNRDLRLAALTVEKAQAIYGIQRATLWPALDGVGSGNKERVPADLSQSGERMTSERYSVDLGILSWEIDFFGRLRSLKDQALEEYLATEQGRRGAQILLISEVANVYLTLATDRENLQLSRSTLASQRDSYNMILRRYETGLVSELDLRQVQTRVDVARRNVAIYTQLTAQDENALNLLVGTQVPTELLPADLNTVLPPSDISPGISSEVLLKRPDILQAEHLLKAANANIGAARAAFFPRISLTAAIGTASAELSGLFKTGSGTWSFSPQAVMPIFDPRLFPALRASKVEQKALLAQYEKSIQAAFREVADALAVRGTVEEQLAAQQSLVEATSETYRLANLRYTKGVDSYLGVLDAQRSLYASQQELVSLRLRKLSNQVRLYSVLGGGWHEHSGEKLDTVSSSP